MSTPKRASAMRAQGRTHRGERLGNWLALLALLAGSVVLAPADEPAAHSGQAGTPRGAAVTAAITMR